MIYSTVSALHQTEVLSRNKPAGGLWTAKWGLFLHAQYQSITAIHFIGLTDSDLHKVDPIGSVVIIWLHAIKSWVVHLFNIRGEGRGWVENSHCLFECFSRSNTVLSWNPFSGKLSCFQNAEKVDQSPPLFVSNSNSFMLLHYRCCLNILSQNITSRPPIINSITRCKICKQYHCGFS